MKIWISLALAALVLFALFFFRQEMTSNQVAAVTASPITKPKQLWHCGMHPQVIQDHPGECPICHMALTPIQNAAGMDLASMHGDQTGPAVTIDPAVVQNMGVCTAMVSRGPLNKTIRTVGMLELPESGMHDIALKVGGWIDRLYADQDGMHVNTGEPLFDLYSPDLQVAEQELIAAVKSVQLLSSDSAPSVRQEAQGMVDSAKRKLRLWDVAEEDIEAIAKSNEPPKDVPFRSPAAGHIEDKMIVQGSAVQPMLKLMRIADHTKMWLEARVYQEQIPVVKIGQNVIATVDGMPGQSWKGTISFIYPRVDHMTRTLTVRMTLDNPNFELKPGMYVTAQIVTQPLSDAIQVPREAVIDTGARQIVFVAERDGHFSPRNVNVGIAGDDDNVQIITGLAPGEAVVTSGQFLMDVESRTIEATQKLMTPLATDTTGTPSQASANLMKDTQSGPASQDMPSSMPAMNDQTPIATQLTTMHELIVVYCPMVKARWLQVGDTIANPYMGQQMSTCGQIEQKVAAPAPADPLDAIVRAYVDVQVALNADRLNTEATQLLGTSATKLPGDRYKALRDSATQLADARDLSSARSALHTFSDQLIALLQQAGQ